MITALTTTVNIEPSHAHAPNIGDLLIQYLEQIGVEYIFGVPGGALEPFYDALARSERRGGPRVIGTRHESGAAFMADGYYRGTGKLGVCCATTGPGATNLITGVVSADKSNIPLLVITGQTALPKFGTSAFQESTDTGIDTVGIFKHFTRYSTLIAHPDQFEHKLVTAIRSAFAAPAGPAHLSIPPDVYRAPAAVSSPKFDLRGLLHPSNMIDDDAVEHLRKLLDQAQKVVFIIGEDCGGAMEPLLRVAEITDATLVATPGGKGFVDPFHPRFKGIIGFAGHDTARDVLLKPEVDLVIAIGVRFGELSMNGGNRAALLGKPLVHIHPCETYFLLSPTALLHVRGIVDAVFRRLGTVLKKARSGIVENTAREQPLLSIDRDSCNEFSPLKPQDLMQQLPRLFSPGTRFLADTGNGYAWAVHYLNAVEGNTSDHSKTCNAWFLGTFLDFGAMGWAVGSAIGLALGGNSNVVCITGDGSLLMNGQEITVAAQERLTVVYIVLNDSALGTIKHGQRLVGAEAIGYKLPSVDFSAFGRSLGANSFVVRHLRDLLDLDIQAICRHPGPTLIDARIDSAEVPPIGLRIKSLRETL